MSNVERPNENIYFVIFEEYLHPKNAQNKLQIFSEEKAQQLKVQREENRAKFLWQKLQRISKISRKNVDEKTSFKIITEQTLTQPNEMPHNAFERLREYLKPLKVKSLKKLHSFFAFLRARNDDGLCRRKTGFEIYCEMASIHGFVNFVGAKTWQRIFWTLVIAFAVLMSVIILVMSHLISVDAPMIAYTESTTFPAWTIPFPAVTVCPNNRISKAKAQALAIKFQPTHVVDKHPVEEIMRLFQHSFFDMLDPQAHKPTLSKDLALLDALLGNNNYTLRELQQEIAVDCMSELRSCRWKGTLRRCDQLFRRVTTMQGVCCSFNYRGTLLEHSDMLPIQTTTCSYNTGLSVVIDPQIADYAAGAFSFPGYHVLLHAPRNYPDLSVERHFMSTRTISTINVVPRFTVHTEHVRSEKLHRRRCYYKGERRQRAFFVHSHTNCLLECRLQLLLKQCGCVLPILPRHTAQIWPVCESAQRLICLMTYSDILTQVTPATDSRRHHFDIDRYSEHFICDCFPSCQSRQYHGILDTAVLDRNFSLGDSQLFKDIVNIDQHILLHVFYGELTAEKLRLDVSENWLSFIGTFGGITGLHMGYSVVSGFEMIFFVFVRPACNWLTRKQIQYHARRRHRKAVVEAMKLKKEQAEK